MNKDDTSQSVFSLAELLSASDLKLLSTNGATVIQQIGMDVVKDVVFDVLTGKNLRDSTETLTRHRVTALNLALMSLFLNGSSSSDDFIQRLPFLASEILSRKRVSKTEQWLARWMIGLTGKGAQNVLRDNLDLLAKYRDNYIEACREVAENHKMEHGELSGVVKTSLGQELELNWLTLAFMLNAVGSQTLTIRGSDKSAYGKLFEKLILGSLLHILGFTYSPTQELEVPDRVFWLSTRGKKRESDATLIYSAGKGIRFDIGFIGRGNTEISLDKVSRFERELQMGHEHYYMATIIIVDRVGARSRIPKLAREIDGRIVQMSGAYWPQQVAAELNHVLGFEHELLHMSEAEIEPFLKSRLADVPIESFIIQPKKKRKSKNK